MIGRSEMEEAAFRVMAGPEKRSRVLTLEEKAIIAYHEVGHALCMKSIAKSDPVSIVARGQALGVTVQLPKRDRYLTSKSERQARMVAAMGGRAREEIIFGDATTGAKPDIEVATRIARHMVCEFGMSERLGLVSLRARDGNDSPLISELTAEDVDAEVKALTDAATGRCKSCKRSEPSWSESPSTCRRWRPSTGISWTRSWPRTSGPRRQRWTGGCRQRNLVGEPRWRPRKRTSLLSR